VLRDGNQFITGLAWHPASSQLDLARKYNPIRIKYQFDPYLSGRRRQAQDARFPCCRPIQGWMLHIQGKMLRVAGQYRDVRIEIDKHRLPLYSDFRLSIDQLGSLFASITKEYFKSIMRYPSPLEAFR
jgi:hypothetical protein